MNSGSVLFVWDSGVTTIARPQYTKTKNKDSGSSNSVTTGGNFTAQCVLQIVAAPDGTVRDFKVTNSTAGDWRLSRCDEVLF